MGYLFCREEEYGKVIAAPSIASAFSLEKDSCMYANMDLHPFQDVSHEVEVYTA